MAMKTIKETPDLIQQLYSIVKKLERRFKGRHFTLDGHLVGSIGEVMAEYHYGLKLARASTKGYDATTRDGRRVEIKTTQGKQVGLRSRPAHLVVLKLTDKGQIEEIYNGPGQPVWSHVGQKQKNGQRPISVTKLRQLMKVVPPFAQLKKVRA